MLNLYPTLLLLPGKSHGQKSLVGYSPWGPKELDTTEQLHFHKQSKQGENGMKCEKWLTHTLTHSKILYPAKFSLLKCERLKCFSIFFQGQDGYSGLKVFLFSQVS